ncbi:hypothetical protein PR048_033390 [Dryococelus australis]|uniref:Uncharacterized protein n=1 Tax=Dryococelus australis TaxID=614101 RepID=A0ABQ9G054_9NEOP|nr:hypothetical protein PR048_033390 [Dryococelus australis]
MQGLGKREIPGKTRRPTASSATISTCENPGVTRPGIEPSSHCGRQARYVRNARNRLDMAGGFAVSMNYSRHLVIDKESLNVITPLCRFKAHLARPPTQFLVNCVPPLIPAHCSACLPVGRSFEGDVFCSVVGAEPQCSLYYEESSRLQDPCAPTTTARVVEWRRAFGDTKGTPIMTRLPF